MHRGLDDKVWAEYEAVYAQSWKPAEVSPEFLRDFARAESAAGRLRLGIAREDGRAIAAQLWTVEGSTAFIHKLAHLGEASARSPGTLLSAALFAHVIDTDKVDLVDFGTGDQSYKADWMDCRRERVGLLAFDQRHWRGWLAASRHILHRYGQRLKQIVSAVVSRR